MADTVTGTTRSVFARTPPRPTEVVELAAALSALWRAADDDGEDIGRALTINFVAVARAENESTLRLAAERLVQRSPARAFLLSIDDALEAPAVEVAAVTRCYANARDTVLEEVVVRLPRSWFPHVPGLIRPLLINDLPTHLYWADDWTDGGDFDQLQALSDHTIVDSRRFSLPAVQLPRLDRRRAAGERLTDLAWLRLRPWRRALAEAFERVTWQPGTAQSGLVCHGRMATASAMLLAHWLETSLGASIVLEESGDHDATCPEAVSLRGSGYEVEVTSADHFAVVHVTTEAACHLPFRLPLSKGTDGDLLAAAIDIA